MIVSIFRTIFSIIYSHKYCHVQMLVANIQLLESDLYLYQFRIISSHRLLLRIQIFVHLDIFFQSIIFYQDFQVIHVLRLYYANTMLWLDYKNLSSFVNRKMQVLFELQQLVHAYHLELLITTN
jgi:hypothetical protein